MFETKVHVFFRSITMPRSFIAFSLDDRSTTFDIEFSSSTTHYTFGAKQYFTGELASSVNDHKSCYLKPLSRYFATFDSFLYQPENLLSGCQSLIGFQVTTAYEHRISVVGLKELQACLNPMRLRLFDQPQPKINPPFRCPGTHGGILPKNAIQGESCTLG
jgi:hypothetical protein